MIQSKIFRENADNCAHLAAGADSEPVFNRYKRMEAAWRALAHEQDWLDGEVSPSRIPIVPTDDGRAPKNIGQSDPAGR
jgi:hypothetical protein